MINVHQLMLFARPNLVHIIWLVFSNVKFQDEFWFQINFLNKWNLM
jgi:hypothetical protein